MQHSLNQRAKPSVKSAAKPFLAVSIMEGNRPACKKPDDLQSIANHPAF
ncbi:hypothetical protein [Ligilactobacillus ruminis]|nr:hypothetical protein [Ligilactobacillus ruminis]